MVRDHVGRVIGVVWFGLALCVTGVVGRPSDVQFVFKHPLVLVDFVPE